MKILRQELLETPEVIHEDRLANSSIILELSNGMVFRIREHRDALQVQCTTLKNNHPSAIRVSPEVANSILVEAVSLYGLK